MIGSHRIKTLCFLEECTFWIRGYKKWYIYNGYLTVGNIYGFQKLPFDYSKVYLVSKYTGYQALMLKYIFLDFFLVSFKLCFTSCAK